LTLIHLTLFTT